MPTENSEKVIQSKLCFKANAREGMGMIWAIQFVKSRRPSFEYSVRKCVLATPLITTKDSLLPHVAVTVATIATAFAQSLDIGRVSK